MMSQRKIESCESVLVDLGVQQETSILPFELDQRLFAALLTNRGAITLWAVRMDRGENGDSFGSMLVI